MQLKGADRARCWEVSLQDCSWRSPKFVRLMKQSLRMWPWGVVSPPSQQPACFVCKNPRSEVSLGGEGEIYRWNYGTRAVKANKKGDIWLSTSHTHTHTHTHTSCMKSQTDMSGSTQVWRCCGETSQQTRWLTHSSSGPIWKPTRGCRSCTQKNTLVWGVSGTCSQSPRLPEARVWGKHEHTHTQTQHSLNKYKRRIRQFFIGLFTSKDILIRWGSIFPWWTVKPSVWRHCTSKLSLETQRKQPKNFC